MCHAWDGSSLSFFLSSKFESYILATKKLASVLLRKKKKNLLLSSRSLTNENNNRRQWMAGNFLKLFWINILKLTHIKINRPECINFTNEFLIYFWKWLGMIYHIYRFISATKWALGFVLRVFLANMQAIKIYMQSILNFHSLGFGLHLRPLCTKLEQ